MSEVASTPRRAGADQAQAEALLRRAIDVIESARPMPLSSDSRINKEEVLELLNEALERLRSGEVEGAAVLEIAR